MPQLWRSPNMRKHRFRSVVFLTLGLSFSQWPNLADPQPIEPSYRGRALTEWLRDCYHLHGHEAPLHEWPLAEWWFLSERGLDHGLDGNPRGMEAVRAIGAKAVPMLMNLLRSKDPRLNDLGLAGFAVLRGQARTAIPTLLTDSRAADESLRSRSTLALACLRAPGQIGSDTTAARLTGRDILLYAERHGGVFPVTLSDPEIAQTFDEDDYWDGEVWPIVKYWRMNGGGTSNDFLLAWPMPGGWICIKSNLVAEFRRDLPESANKTVQRTGASGSAHETNRTSSAAGSRR
jgi:hypothetical protein